MARTHRGAHRIETSWIQAKAENPQQEVRDRTERRGVSATYQGGHANKGLADKDMDFTPRESGSWEKTGHVWIRHLLQQRRSVFMAGTNSGPIVSELQPDRLTSVFSLSKQPGGPPLKNNGSKQTSTTFHRTLKNFHMTVNDLQSSSRKNIYNQA